MDAWFWAGMIFDNFIAYSSSSRSLLEETTERQVANKTEIRIVSESNSPVLWAGGNSLKETAKKTKPEVIAAPNEHNYPTAKMSFFHLHGIDNRQQTHA